MDLTAGEDNNFTWFNITDTNLPVRITSGSGGGNSRFEHVRTFNHLGQYGIEFGSYNDDLDQNFTDTRVDGNEFLLLNHISGQAFSNLRSEGPVSNLGNMILLDSDNITLSDIYHLL